MVSVDPTMGRQLFGRGAVYTLASVAQMAAGVLAIPAATRLLSTAEFGTVALVIVVMQLSAMLGAVGLPGAITRAYFSASNGGSATRELIGASAVSAAVFVLVAGGVAAVWGTSFGIATWGPGLWYGLLAGCLLSVVHACQALLRAQNRAARYVLVSIASSVGGHVTGVGLVVVVAPTAELYAIGLLSGVVVGLVIALVSTGVSWPARMATLRWGLAIGLPTVPHLVSRFAMEMGDRVVIEWHLGLEAVGEYQVAYQIGALGMMLIGAVNNAWSPLYFGAPDEQRAGLLALTSSWLHHLAALGAVGIACGSPIAVIIAAPPTYSRAELVPIASVVAFSAIAQVTYLGRVNLLFQHERTRSLLWVTPSLAVANLALNVALVPRYGLMAAASVTVLVYLLQGVLLELVSRRMELIPWHRRAEAGAYAFALVGCSAGAVLPVDGLWLGLRILIVLFCLAAGLVALRRMIGVATSPVTSPPSAG